jgi:hypothetical protein
MIAKSFRPVPFPRPGRQSRGEEISVENKQNHVHQLKQSIDESLERLAHAVYDQGASETFRQYLDTLARFHRYSWKNCLLIVMQKPEATRVAGFTAWKEFGRSVKPGEKGIRIFAPCPYPRR